MDKNKFTKLTRQEKEGTFGGNAWLLAIPLVLSSVASLVGSIKAFMSHGSGSIKTSANGGVDAKWGPDESSSSSSSSKRRSSSSHDDSSSKTKSVFYAY